MVVIGVAAVVAFDTILCIFEIPKMLKQKQIKELITFAVLLLLGTAIIMLKSFDIPVPNPLDWIAWVYQPFKGIMQSLLEP